MTKKWVYLFEEGNRDMRDLLGGKGANLAEMTNAGLPVPPGFTITTEACNAYFEAGQQFPDGMWIKCSRRRKRSKDRPARSSVIRPTLCWSPAALERGSPCLV